MLCCITVMDRLDVFRFHRVWQKSQRKKDGMTNRTGNVCRLGKFAILCVCILWYYIPSSSVSRASVAHLATDPVLTLKSTLRIRSPNSIYRVNVYLIDFCAEHLIVRSRSNPYCFFVFLSDFRFLSFTLNSMKPRKFFCFLPFSITYRVFHKKPELWQFVVLTKTKVRNIINFTCNYCVLRWVLTMDTESYFIVSGTVNHFTSNRRLR